MPLLWLHGDHDLLAEIETHGRVPFSHANAPKALVVLAGGHHLGFSDVGVGIDDAFACSLLPDPGSLVSGATVMAAGLGGEAHGVSLDGCTVPSCTGNPSHSDGRRQQQITKQVGAAFFAAVLRSDPKAERYIARDLAATSPDLSHVLVAR